MFASPGNDVYVMHQGYVYPIHHVNPSGDLTLVTCSEIVYWNPASGPDYRNTA